MTDPLQRSGKAAAFFSALLLIGSASWFAWKGPALGFDPVKAWMFGGGTLFFLSMGGFFAARHHAAAWRWMIVALVHSLALSAFGQFASATGLGVEYGEWSVRGGWVARNETMAELLGLYLLGSFITSAVCWAWEPEPTPRLTSGAGMSRDSKNPSDIRES